MRLRLCMAVGIGCLFGMNMAAGFGQQSGKSSLASAAVLTSPKTSYGLPLKPERLLKWEEHEGTWVSLDISPDGTTIVFELLGDLYTMPAAGGEAKCIACGLSFDSQPVYSPDGKKIAFVSDRDGNENLWIANPDGSGLQQISAMEENSVFVSPEWARDGHSIYISRYKPDMNAFELWRYASDGSKHEPMEQVTHAKRTPDTPKENRVSALGAALSPDGNYLYYESKTGLGYDDDIGFPLWHIVRRDLRTGEERNFVSAQGSAFCPRVSPDGKYLVYATRYEGKTGLRRRNLLTDEDKPLVYPIQRDDQEGIASRDLLPRYALTPDGKSLLTNHSGKLYRVDLASGAEAEIAFVAHVELPVGPYLRPELKQDRGPVQARLIQTPAESPDGKRLVFSALTNIYTAQLSSTGKISLPLRLTKSARAEFEPSWSADGQWIVYVSWSAETGGEIWKVRADGQGEPEKLTDHSDYYAYPVFAPDGRSVFALRAVDYDRLRQGMDFPPYQADVIEISLEGNRSTRIVASGFFRGGAQFTREPGVLYLNFSDGLYRLSRDNSKPQRVVYAYGPSWYFFDGTAPAGAVKISPDGKWALAEMNQQLYLLQLAEQGKELSVELAKPSSVETRLTSVGLDFFGWADGGKTITWSLGSTFFREKLADVKLGSSDVPLGTDMQRPGIQTSKVVVEVPRDTPRGALVLRGGTAITMKRDTQGRDEVISDADVVIVDDHIAAVGKRGTVAIPQGAEVRDVTGRFLIPGFTDVHIHWGSIRRNILDTETWAFQAALAYGITSALDPSALSIDTFAYQDLIDSGRMVGTRVYTTGPALFSFNLIDTEEQALNNIRRNPEFYRTRNLKEYRTGNRRQRELVVEASRQLDLLTTTEGAMDMKLDMTQIQDGFSGSEHAYSAVPIADDIVQLFARSGVSYTPTMQISNGGMIGEYYFFTKNSPYRDEKLRRFIPQNVLARKLERMHWGLPQEFSFPQIAEGAARIQRAGGLVGVGSHGEVPGIGYHYELQSFAMGGMKPMEILRAATIDSSKTIGRDSEFGSLEAGKFADLIVLEKDPLVNIENTLSIQQVMKDGHLYDGGTLDEVWPKQRKQPSTWWQREGWPSQGKGN